jgi:hypothetical protein
MDKANEDLCEWIRVGLPSRVVDCIWSGGKGFYIEEEEDIELIKERGYPNEVKVLYRIGGWIRDTE